MLASTDGGHSPGPGPAQRVRDAGARLLAQRVAQQGRPTLGDEADEGFHAVLATLPLPDEETVIELRLVGEAIGRHVYAKRFVDEPLHGAIGLLSESLRASGASTLRAEAVFHREARVVASPTSPSLHAYLEGVLSGYLRECYNCDVEVRSDAQGSFLATLGPGRDVNRRRSP